MLANQNKQLITRPGLYPNISIEDYHASPGISSTGMKVLLDCPKRYWYEYISGLAVKEEKQHFLIGKALHTLVLEPDTFDSRYYVEKEKYDRRTNAGKEAAAKAEKEADGKTILQLKDYSNVINMATSVKAHKHFSKILRNGHIENSIAWKDKDSGALLRSRPDYFNDFMITDLKITSGAAKHYFSRSIAEYGYHRQAALACDGLSENTGVTYDTVVLFVVEDKPPHLCVCYVISEDAIETGRVEYKKAARIYQQCLSRNEWPGYDQSIQEIDLPKWYYSAGEQLND